MAIEDTGNSAEFVETDDLDNDIANAIAASSGNDETETQEQADQRARDERGRFTQKTDEAPAEAAKPTEAAPVEKPIADPDKSIEQPAAVSTPTAAPPVSWSAEAKAEWSKLPPAIQEAAIKREAEVNEGFRRLSEERRQLEPLAKAVEPHLQMFQRYNTDPATGIQKLMAAQEYLTRDPVNAIRWLAQERGVNLRALAEMGDMTVQQVQMQQPQYQQPVDIPAIVRSQMQQAQIEQEVERFATSQPYYAEVERELLVLVPYIKQEHPELSPSQVLKEAYDRAVYANPATRAKVIASTDTDRIAKAQADQKANAAKARGAAVSLRGSPASGAANTSPLVSVGDVDDDIKAAMAALR